MVLQLAHLKEHCRWACEAWELRAPYTSESPKWKEGLRHPHLLSLYTVNEGIWLLLYWMVLRQGVYY